MVITKMSMVRLCNGCEPTSTRTSEKLGDLGGSKGGADSDGHEKENG